MKPAVLLVLAAVAAALGPAGCGTGEDPADASWELDGEPATFEQFLIGPGPEHCDWTSVTILSMAWPPGSGDRSANSRQFVRDPAGKLPPGYTDGLDLTARPPEDAAPSGYADGQGLELWFAESSGGETAYLVHESGDAEAWPRADPPVGCD
jgi:hypothetical protein